jgi:hypothetical protein
MNKSDKPEIWETRMLGEWVLPKTVEFSAEEVQMIREMSWKTGYPRSEVIREAVRRLYDNIILRD